MVGCTVGPLCLAAAASPLETIQQRGYLIVAVKDNLKPLSFQDQQGNLSGFEIDLAHALASALFNDERAVKFVPVLNQERLSVLKDDRADLVIANWSITIPRARTVDFSIPYLQTSLGILLRQDSSTDSLGDLENSRLAVVADSSSHQALRLWLPESGLVPVRSYVEGYEALIRGEVSGFAADNTVLSGWLQNHTGYRLLPSTLDGAGLAIGMPRGLATGRLRDWVNAQLEHLRKQGWLDRQAAVWGLLPKR
ncbi:MAG: transporter substrate-binding domain-containing protein [Gemmatimonadaceae bacterium]|nr:transporter substrate-binding domain-containing protein [Gloeobacterales cyanobacterium ES-bin-141]